MNEPTTPDGGDPAARTSVRWFAAYVYGTIATLVAIASLNLESVPGPLICAAVVIVGAVAIWLAHATSELVAVRARNDTVLHASDVWVELRQSWPIVSAAFPATVILALAGLGAWSTKSGLVIAEVFGVVALVAVGVGTVGGAERSLARRVGYVAALVSIGVVIVLLELAAHSV